MLQSNTNHFLGAISPSDFARLSPHLIEGEWSAGEVVNEVNTSVDHVVFPTGGVLSVLKVMIDGRTVETRTIGCESAFGLLHALGARPSLSRVIMQLRGSAIKAPSREIKRLAEDSSSFMNLIVRHAQVTFGQAEQSVACNALHPVEPRLARWLLMSHDRTDQKHLELTQDFLAMMLGVQRTTVTVAARALQARRLIDYSRGVVRILDRPALEACACECYEAVKTQGEALRGQTLAA